MTLEPPPREIDRRMSRALRNEHGGRARVGIAFIITSAVFFAAFYVFTVPPWRTDLDQRGAVTAGEIVAVDSGDWAPWLLRYSYDVPSGETFNGEMETGDLMFSLTHHPGDSVEVSYDPSNPSISKIRGVEIAGSPWWVLILPCAGFVVSVVYAILGCGKYLAARRVYETGLETAGMIVRGKVPLLYMISSYLSYKPVRIGYVFEDENGEEHSNSVLVYHRKAYEWMQTVVGTGCTVLYDREESSSNLLYDSLRLRIEDGKS